MQTFFGYYETSKEGEIFAFNSEDDMNRFLGGHIIKEIGEHNADCPTDPAEATKWLYEQETDFTGLFWFKFDWIDHAPEPEIKPENKVKQCTLCCPNCGSENIIGTSDVRWNPDLQEWVGTADGMNAEIDCDDCSSVFYSPVIAMK